MTIEKQSNPLTKYDLGRVFQTPYGADYETLEELAKAHKCTVEEIAARADLADPVACVEAALKLNVEKIDNARAELDKLLLRRGMVDLLAYAVCECEDAILIEEADAAYEESLHVFDEAGNETIYPRRIKEQNGYYILESQLLISMCELLNIELYGDDRVHWFDIQDRAIDLEVEIKALTFGLGLESTLDPTSEWLTYWDEAKADMMRIDALLKEKPVLK